MSRYRIVEKVTFEYVWDVEAKSAEAAQATINNMGDGEAAEHNEIDRRIVSVVKQRKPR